MGKMTIAGATLAALALASGGCSKGQQAGTQEAAVQASSALDVSAPPSALAAAPATFGQCASCHSIEPGKHGIGPSLFGVYGTKAGEIPGYAFSAPLKASGLTWDDATLDRWLAGPMKLVPGTKMTYAGLDDPAKRKALIDWLKTLK